MPQDQPGSDEPTQQLPSQGRASSDQPTQQLPSQGRASSDQPTQQLPSQGRASSDQPTPQRSSGFLSDQQSRRLFLKAAVISGAAVAAVGATGVAAANASPQILRQLRGEPATTSGGCIGLKEASKDNKDGPNNFLELSTGGWNTLRTGPLGDFPCILVTDKNHPAHTLLTTVTCNGPKGDHILLGICPPIPKGAANTFPEGSCVTLATDCPPQVDCGTSPCIGL